ncbi:MAG: hypothetical protein LBU27_02600 [Candidatus Peribacteria bacterium]|jgi:antitoxin component of MazEF toxin-antitoxin module|nr:hypothetical protein [Candidatus Peribacteria bacterium]
MKDLDENGNDTTANGSIPVRPAKKKDLAEVAKMLEEETTAEQKPIKKTKKATETEEE